MLSASEIADARALLGTTSLRGLAKHFGISREGLRRQIDPDYRAASNAYHRLWMAREARVRRQAEQMRARISATRSDKQEPSDDEDNYQGLPQPRDPGRSGLAAR